jgi:hypothetical protein
MADAKAAYEDAANAQVVVEDVDFESAWLVREGNALKPKTCKHVIEDSLDGAPDDLPF